MLVTVYLKSFDCQLQSFLSLIFDYELQSRNCNMKQRKENFFDRLTKKLLVLIKNNFKTEQKKKVFRNLTFFRILINAIGETSKNNRPW